jgi:putative flippase GtrA
MAPSSTASGLLIRKTINDFFILKSNNTLIQLVRYTLAGGIAFVADFGSLYTLTEFLHIYYLVSAAIAFSIGVTVKYAFSIVWVFDRRTIQSPWIEFFIFGIIGVTGLGLSLLFMWFLTEKTHLHYLASKIIAAILVFFWNFFARKFTLFN